MNAGCTLRVARGKERQGGAELHEKIKDKEEKQEKVICGRRKLVREEKSKR